MDTDIVYILMIMLMTCMTSIVTGERFVFKSDPVEIGSRESVLAGINILIPVMIYMVVYQYGITNYNNKRMLIGVLSSVYLVSILMQYIIMSRESDEECSWKISTKKYQDVKDSVYRLAYTILMISIPLYLEKSSNIVMWALCGPIMIPLFLYMSSYLLGLGVDGRGKIIDAGDYYGTFVRGIDKEDNYTDSGLMINILRSLVRGILLIVMFIISFLMSKKIVNVEKTSPSSIIVFLVIISSILPLMLGYLVEPKCLLRQAESKDESEGLICIADKHGGLYGYLIYILVCGMIIIWKDN